MHKQVIFVARLPSDQSAFHYTCIGDAKTLELDWNAKGGTRVEIANYYPLDQSRWANAFITWLGALNMNYASPEWWAHIATAKNLLSSPLGNWLLEVMALKKAIDTLAFEKLYIIGATDAQAITLSRAPHQAVDYVVEDRLVRERKTIEFWIRLAYQCLRVFLSYIVPPWNFRTEKAPDICLFTYVNNRIKKNSDAFFGTLPEELRLQRPGLACVYLAFLHSPFLSTLKQLRATPLELYWPLFFELLIRDVFWAATKTIAAYKEVGDLRPPDFADALNVREILQDALWHDIVRGGYFFNLLVFRAARRYAFRCQPKKLIYPYENKSLEKLLILGFRSGFPLCRIIGYQHTSITPRHTTLLFAKGESAYTPLPDRIFTAGAIPKQYLEEHGEYPPGILSVACALRQNWRPAYALSQARPDKPLRVLLALSSSRMELISAVSFFEQVAETCKNRIELLIRPHPEFGLNLLPGKLASWARKNARDGTGTDLENNLAWCDVTAYISSTVALETLMIGKPIVNIDIGEPLSPDPVIGDIALHTRIRNVRDFQNYVDKLLELSQASYGAMATEALSYVQNYLGKVTPARVSVFLD